MDNLNIDLSLRPSFLIEKSNAWALLKSKRKWTLQEQRFLVSYLAKINPRDNSTKSVRYSLDDFCNLFDLDEESRKPSRLKKTAERMLSHVMIETKDGEGLAFKMRSFLLFSICNVEDARGKYYVDIEAHDDAMELMFDLDKYFSYRLEHVLKLSSSGQLRLYEILKLHELRGMIVLTLDEIRDWVCGNVKSYPEYRDLSQKVLKKYQKIINETTDINFTYKPRRVGDGIGGKPTVAVEFKIQGKKMAQMSFFENEAKKGVDITAEDFEG